MAALLEWPLDRPPLTQEMSAVVIHYFTEKSDIDVDGIGKLVLDALKGAVIEDDRAISQVILRKSNQVDLLISNPPPVLADALGSHENFVYVQLNEAPNHEELPE